MSWGFPSTRFNANFQSAPKQTGWFSTLGGGGKVVEKLKVKHSSHWTEVQFYASIIFPFLCISVSEKEWCSGGAVQHQNGFDPKSMSGLNPLLSLLLLNIAFPDEMLFRFCNFSRWTSNCCKKWECKSDVDKEHNDLVMCAETSSWINSNFF